jgi:hypothetical protein
MTLGLAQPLNRHEYWGSPLRDKGGRCTGLITLLLSNADFLKIVGASAYWSPRAYLGMYRDSFTFTFYLD